MSMVLGRLVGRVPVMIVVMGIFDNIVEALDEWVDGLGARFSNAMGQFASWGIRTALEFYTNDLLPDANVFKTGSMSEVFGSFNGLAVKILTLFVLISVLATLFAVVQHKQAVFAAKTTASLIRFILFVFLFFPLYALVVAVVVTFGSWFLKVSAGIEGNSSSTTVSDQIIAIMVPDNLLMQAISGLFNGVIMMVLICEGLGLLIIGSLAAITHGLSTAARPAGDAGLNQYKLSVAVLWTVPLSIIAITILLGLDLLTLRMANTQLWPDLSGLAGLLSSLIFGVLMILAPLGVGWLVFTKVNRTITSGENRIQNAIDIGTMPQVDARQIEDASQRQQQSIVTEFAQGLPAAIASGENGPGTEAKELAKQIAIQRAMASGNPAIVTGVAGYTAIKTVQKIRESITNEGGDERE